MTTLSPQRQAFSSRRSELEKGLPLGEAGQPGIERHSAPLASLPTFLLIGDAKAGTTSLYSYLRQHPDIYMPNLKEPGYLAYDEDNPYHVRAKAFPVKTFSDYVRLFESCGEASAIGEASTNYLRTPGTADRIRTVLPDVRLVASLRNPADRLYSSYLMACRHGRVRRPFDEEVFGRSSAIIKANFYWPDLKPYFDLFPSHQIRIVLFDDIRRDALSVIKDLYAFIGVDDSFVPDLDVRNAGGVPRNRLCYVAFHRGRRLMQQLEARPKALRLLSREIERRLLRKTTIDPQIRRKILEASRDDILKTQELIGRDLSSWLV